MFLKKLIFIIEGEFKILICFHKQIYEFTTIVILFHLFNLIYFVVKINLDLANNTNKSSSLEKIKETQKDFYHSEHCFLLQAEIAKRSATQNITLENQKSIQAAAQPSNIQSCITNLCVIIGFAAFAFTVKYVMKTIASETE